MGSRASSDAPVTGSPTQIPALPGLGTTWYKRGARYWLRRIATAALWLSVLAFLCYIELRLYVGVPRTDLPPTVRRVWDVAQAIMCCAALVWGWVKQRRELRKGLVDPPTPKQAQAARRGRSTRAPGLARAAVLPALIVAPVLPAILAYAVSWFVAWLTVREYPSEVGARRWMQARAART